MPMANVFWKLEKGREGEKREDLTTQFQLRSRNYNPDSYREELRSSNKALGFPITQFLSPLGRHPKCPQQSWGMKFQKIPIG